MERKEKKKTPQRGLRDGRTPHQWTVDIGSTLINQKVVRKVLLPQKPSCLLARAVLLAVTRLLQEGHPNLSLASGLPCGPECAEKATLFEDESNASKPLGIYRIH